MREKSNTSTALLVLPATQQTLPHKAKRHTPPGSQLRENSPYHDVPQCAGVTSHRLFSLRCLGAGKTGGDNQPSGPGAP